MGCGNCARYARCVVLVVVIAHITSFWGCDTVQCGVTLLTFWEGGILHFYEDGASNILFK